MYFTQPLYHRQDATQCQFYGGARDIMVIVAGNGHGDTFSNAGRN